MKAKSKIEPGRPEFMIGAHCLNHNAHSIGICYEGGLDIRGQPADKLKGWCPWVLLVIVLQRTAVKNQGDRSMILDRIKRPVPMILS